ncbi:MAG: fibrobacter succinogenes major paralogous domain-containing protein [Mediterranea sp.]|nr:fibrobacter succinogenes major paralogous domain-containing protein [Mediterranea sp.]
MNWGTNALYPAAGWRIVVSGNLNDVGTFGIYWSASPDNNTSYNASFLDFSSGDVNVDGIDYRAYGFSVRCTRE